MVMVEEVIGDLVVNTVVRCTWHVVCPCHDLVTASHYLRAVVLLQHSFTSTHMLYMCTYARTTCFAYKTTMRALCMYYTCFYENSRVRTRSRRLNERHQTYSVCYRIISYPQFELPFISLFLESAVIILHFSPAAFLCLFDLHTVCT